MIILRPHMKIRLFNNVKGITLSVYFSLLIALAICCKPDDKPPAEVLTKAQMVALFREIYIAEDKINRLGTQHDSSLVLIEILKDKVLEKYGTSDSIFQSSFNYYIDHPKEMELIYTALVDSLQLEEERTRMAK
jgi:hypothetical protein